MIDNKPPSSHKPLKPGALTKPFKGIANAIGEQCDDIEKKRVEQTDKMRLLLQKLGRIANPKTVKP